MYIDYYRGINAVNYANKETSRCYLQNVYLYVPYIHITLAYQQKKETTNAAPRL